MYDIKFSWLIGLKFEMRIGLIFQETQLQLRSWCTKYIFALNTIVPHMYTKYIFTLNTIVSHMYRKSSPFRNVVFMLWQVKNRSVQTHLVQKRKQIHIITDCNVLVDVVPDQPRGKRWCFKSQHYQDLQNSINNESAKADATVEITSVFTQ